MLDYSVKLIRKKYTYLYIDVETSVSGKGFCRTVINDQRAIIVCTIYIHFFLNWASWFLCSLYQLYLYYNLAKNYLENVLQKYRSDIMTTTLLPVMLSGNTVITPINFTHTA